MESLEKTNTSVYNRFVWDMTASILVLAKIYPLAAKPAAYIFVREDSGSKFLQKLVRSSSVTQSNIQKHSKVHNRLRENLIAHGAFQY